MKIYTAVLLYNPVWNPCCSFPYGVEKQSGFDSGEKNKKVFVFGSSRATFKSVPLGKCLLSCEKY